MRERIKILHIITRMEEGGAPRVLLDLLRGLDRDRFSQTLASGPAREGTDLLPEARGLSIPVEEIAPLCRPISPARDVSALVTLAALIKRGGFDIIHTHTSKAGFLGRLAARFAGAGRVVYSPHGDIFSGYFSAVETEVYTAAERMAARWCARIVTLSDAGALEYLARGIGKERQFVTIPNGVDADTLARMADRGGARRELGAGENDVVIAYAGRLVPVKGCDILAAAAPGIVAGVEDGRAIRFIIAGEGPEREALAARVRELGVADRFSFLGFRNDVPRLLSACDLLVMPSINEGLGMTILEAMALSVPVVASRVGGIPEAVTDGVTGILVGPGRPDELAGACVELIRDGRRAREMGRAGNRAVRERFSTGRYIEKTARLYLDLMGAS